MRIDRARGIDALHLVTRLLQRGRSEHPTAGGWEAADFQWWWRVERESDSMDQVFALDGDGEPVGAAVLTRWPSVWGLDILALPSAPTEVVETVWDQVADRVRALVPPGVESILRDDDVQLAGLLTAAGFSATDQRDVTTWLEVGHRPPRTPAPDGYRLSDRSEAGDRPHHFIPRSGADVGRRLRQTPLYDPWLDVFMEDANGDVAAYVLFWFDPATATGMIEPVRTEEGHQRRGLARHIITIGIDRLASLGAGRVKVNYEMGNAGAEALYVGLGFEPVVTSAVYRLG